MSSLRFFLGFAAVAALGLATLVPRFGARFAFSSLLPDFVYAASGWALVLGARLKLKVVRYVLRMERLWTYSFAFCVRLVCL